LSICEDGAIEALNGGIHHIFCYLIEYLFLFGVHIEEFFEQKRAFLFLIIDVSFLLIFLDEELCPGFLAIEVCMTIEVLKPLYTFLWGRTLR
jgi:hypothetical protein